MELDNKRIARFRFIEALLLEHGYVRRSYLHRAYGISLPQVSRLLVEFREAAPEAAEFDPSTKTWTLREGYKPKWLETCPREFIDAMITVACEPIFDLAKDAPKPATILTSLASKEEIDQAFDSYEESCTRLAPHERRLVFHALVSNLVQSALRMAVRKFFRMR